MYSRPDKDFPLLYSRGQVRFQLLRNSHEFVLAPLGSLDENHARSRRFRRAFTRHFHREHARLIFRARIYRNASENVLIVVALPSPRKSTNARTLKCRNSTVVVKKKSRTKPIFAKRSLNDVFTFVSYNFRSSMSTYDVFKVKRLTYGDRRRRTRIWHFIVNSTLL